jgi:hypothetical protein
MKPCTSSFSTFALGALLIAAYFFALAGPALRAGFTTDALASLSFLVHYPTIFGQGKPVPLLISEG